MPPSRRRSLHTVTLVLVVAVVLAIPLLAMIAMMPMMMQMGVGGTMPMSPAGGLGMMLAVGLVLVAAAVLLYRAVVGRAGTRREPALEELRLAYARGDCTQEEFEQRREALRQSE